MGPFKDKLTELAENEALFARKDIAILSGSGRADKHKIKENNSVEHDSNVTF